MANKRAQARALIHPIESILNVFDQIFCLVHTHTHTQPSHTHIPFHASAFRPLYLTGNGNKKGIARVSKHKTHSLTTITTITHTRPHTELSAVLCRAFICSTHDCFRFQLRRLVSSSPTVENHPRAQINHHQHHHHHPSICHLL